MAQFFWMVIETLGSLLTVACVLRAYSYRLHLSPNNPMSHFLAAVTDWLVQPLRKLVAPRRSWDWASLLAALLIALLTALLSFVVVGTFVPDPIVVAALALIWLVRWSLWLVFGLLIAQAVLSWVNPYAPMAPAIDQLTRPLLAPIRRVVPLLGGVDLSPLVLMLLLQGLLMLVDPGVVLGLLLR